MRRLLASGLALHDGAALVGDPIAVLPVLLHLLWRHELRASLSRQLHPDTLVTTVDAEVLKMTGKPVLSPGDEICFDGGQHQVLGLSGTSVRLRSDAGAEQVVLAGCLMSAPDFAVLGAPRCPRSSRSACSVRSRPRSWRPRGDWEPSRRR